MNKTRFYEITQAAAKGEDLSQFVPTNAAEAALIADLGGGGATIELPSGGTPITSDNVPLSTLYFKTEMSADEINSIIEQANSANTMTEVLEGMIPIFGDDYGTMFAFSIFNGAYCIMFGYGSSWRCMYQSADVVGEGFVGWNPAIFADKNYFTMSEMSEMIGSSNIKDFEEFEFLNDSVTNIITPLVSANKDFSAGGLKGTPLEAGVECRKFYPNLNASLEDIVSTFDEYASLCVNYPQFITFYNNQTTGDTYAFMPTTGKNSNGDDVFTIMLVNGDMQPEIVCYMSPVTDDMLSQIPEGMTIVDGWQTQNLTEEGCFEIPSELVWDSTQDHPAEAYAVLSKIFSAGKPYSDGKKKVSGTYDGSEITVTVTGDQTIDLEALLDQNKLPLKINVKVSE